MSRALIFVNGEYAQPALTRGVIRTGDVLIAADGGARQLAALGLLPSVIIGDLDSLSADEVDRFRSQGVEIRRYPPEKDETDLELALNYALGRGFEKILVVGALGGRLDQTLGNIGLLAQEICLEKDVRLDDGQCEVFFIRSQAEIEGKPGEAVSFVAWGNPVMGVSTCGLRYPLKGETLYPERTRSISNEMLEGTASLVLTGGLLLCIHTRNV